MTLHSVKRSRILRRAAPFAFGAAVLAGALGMYAGPAAAAVVYCTGPGYPKGCVVRTAPAPAVRAAVYCTRPGYPVGCVGSPTARAVARPGPGVNLGGPVNRAGIR